MKNTLSPELKNAIFTAITEKNDVTYEEYSDVGRVIKTITPAEAFDLVPVYIDETLNDIFAKVNLFSKRIDRIIEKQDEADKLLTQMNIQLKGKSHD
ncbi:MAG: hypothetical protein Q7T50_00020 [Candidatus Magasanikbacteria bacterium]|nr:hypothetical protein [Candidatus Magasanikbacteria bacterium]